MGPAIGFLLGFACLSLYIDPKLHPVITKQDPRWLGAWWLGWIILGVTMGTFAVLIAMFPRNLPTLENTGKTSKQVSHVIKHYVIKVTKMFTLQETSLKYHILVLSN